MPFNCRHLRVLILGTSALLAACSADAPPSQATDAPTAATSPTETAKEAAMSTLMSEDINAFVPAGMKLVDSVRGDLTGNGGNDALLVAAAPSPADAMLGQGQPRSVLLLRDQGKGVLQLAARNDRLVPCERCGGLAGDPYAFSAIHNGTFSVSVSGGSRERWASDYHFQYQADGKRWQLARVERVVSDTITDEQKTQQLDASELGQPGFTDFDPATLPDLPQLGAEGQ